MSIEKSLFQLPIMHGVTRQGKLNSSNQSGRLTAGSNTGMSYTTE